MRFSPFPTLTATAALALTFGGAAGCAVHAADPPPGSPVTIKIDVTARRHPISPLIYGVNYAGKNAEALNCPLDRYGGNNTTRYNWKENADNRAQDWFFESIANDDATPGARVTKIVTDDKAQGARSLITVPILGWVAHVKPDRSKTWSFSIQKYGPQQKSEGDAGNGVRSDGKNVTGNDPRDANIPVDSAYMRPWIAQLRQSFGASNAGGVYAYLLDNEPGIWHSTHRDVQPVGVKMDDLFAKSRATASMIKSVDPTARVAGPEEWGWTGYEYSGYDSQWGGTHGWHGAMPDMSAHGGIWMAPWYLQQFAKAEKTGGKRLLDIFTVHFYPQGGEFSGDTSPQMQARRNRSTRALWDPNYKDETWINDTVRLVPRMKQWVAENYPGTKTGVTEYSWGADENINGATAEADILGIFGREGLDLANRWTCPDPKTPTFKAFQMYRNYDGHKSAFGDESVACDAPYPDSVAAFAAQDSKSGALTVMVVAKAAGASPTPVTLALAHFAGAKSARVYQLTEKNTIEHLADVPVSASGMTLRVPPQSVTLVVVPK